jgi:hypothetical protein
MSEGEPPPPPPGPDDDVYDVSPPSLPPVPPPHTTPHRPVPVQPLTYGTASYQSLAELRGYPVLGQQLAKASWAAPCIAFGLNCCAGGATRHSAGAAVIGVVNLGLILFGFGAGIVCLTQMRRWGRSGVLAPAVVGVCLNGLLILAMVSVIVLAVMRR